MAEIGRTVLGGGSGIEVSTLGLGCMGMSDFYGEPDEAGALRTLDRAIGLGVNFFDTADVYGLGSNEELVGKALAPRRSGLVIATKFGLVRNGAGDWLGVNGKPEYVRSCCDASLARLGVDEIDLYYQHRADAETPIEETVGAMKELVEAGKVRALGLSEVSASTLRRACAVHPIAALQTEYSLWSREPEGELIPACRELGVTFVPYSPLGRGMLAGAVSSREEMPAHDYRHNTPRFQGENFDRNRALAARLEEVASGLGATPAQVALAWVLAQNPSSGPADIVPIPGTKRVKYLEQNVAAAGLDLDEGAVSMLEELFPRTGAAAGDRYPAHRMTELNR